ncbi:hypothetical protein ACLB1M_31135 [Escherichia coli]
MKDLVNGQMTDEVKAATSTQIFSVNQTDKGKRAPLITTPAESRAGGAGGADAATLSATAGESLLSGRAAAGSLATRFCVTLNWRKQWRQTAQMPSVAKNC